MAALTGSETAAGTVGWDMRGVLTTTTFSPSCIEGDDFVWIEEAKPEVC
jgi:hypothetical protein